MLTRQAGLVDAFRHMNPTAPGFTDGQHVESARRTAGQPIDYVFVAPGERVPGRIVASRVVLHEPRGAGRVRWPSDRHGVLADIALQRPTAARLAGDGDAPRRRPSAGRA
jgi:exonuclease III